MERYVELDKRGTRDRDFRCATITPLETLEVGGMLHRMELMCMQVQADLTRQVEEIEPDKVCFEFSKKSLRNRKLEISNRRMETTEQYGRRHHNGASGRRPL